MSKRVICKSTFLLEQTYLYITPCSSALSPLGSFWGLKNTSLHIKVLWTLNIPPPKTKSEDKSRLLKNRVRNCLQSLTIFTPITCKTQFYWFLQFPINEIFFFSVEIRERFTNEFRGLTSENLLLPLEDLVSFVLTHLRFIWQMNTKFVLWNYGQCCGLV